MDLIKPVICNIKGKQTLSITEDQFHLRIVKIKPNYAEKKLPNLLLSDGQSTIKAKLSHQICIDYKKSDIIKVKKYILKIYKTNKMYLCIKDCEVIHLNELKTIKNSSMNYAPPEEKKLPLNLHLLSHEISNDPNLNLKGKQPINQEINNLVMKNKNELIENYSKIYTTSNDLILNELNTKPILLRPVSLGLKKVKTSTNEKEICSITMIDLIREYIVIEFSSNTWDLYSHYFEENIPYIFINYHVLKQIGSEKLKIQVGESTEILKVNVEEKESSDGSLGDSDDEWADIKTILKMDAGKYVNVIGKIVNVEEIKNSKITEKSPPKKVIILDKTGEKITICLWGEKNSNS